MHEGRKEHEFYDCRVTAVYIGEEPLENFSSKGEMTLYSRARDPGMRS